MLNTILSSTPSVDPYQSIKQQMAAVGSDKVGLKNGNYPFVIEGRFLEGQVVLPNGEKRTLKTTPFTAVNDLTIDKIDLFTAIKEKRFTSFRIENGRITVVFLHHHWTGKMEQENILDVSIKSRMDMNYRVPEENDTMFLSPMEENEYFMMIKMLGFNDFIQV